MTSIWHTTWSWCDTIKNKTSERFIIFSKLARLGEHGFQPVADCRKRCRRPQIWGLEMVILRSINGVLTPPMVSIPRVSGVTSSKRISLTSPWRTPPWIATPMATTSSGLTPCIGSLLKRISPSQSQLACGHTTNHHDFINIFSLKFSIFKGLFNRLSQTF